MRRVSKLVAVLAAAGMLFSGGGLAAAADGVGGASGGTSQCVPGKSTIAQCFPDKALAQGIARQLKGDAGKTGEVLTSNDVYYTTNLSFSDSSVSSVQGLQVFTKLRFLNLPKTRVSDVSALGKLANLETLDLSGTRVSDVSALAKLTKLWHLNLSGTRVSDVSALAKLTKLSWLDLSDTLVSDVSALAKLTNLEELYLSGTKVSDVSALAKLTKLSELDLSKTQVSDASLVSVAKLTNLWDLYLSGTKVSDVSALAKLTNLWDLDLSNTRVSDVSALGKLTNLTYLDLSGTQVLDIRSLHGLPLSSYFQPRGAFGLSLRDFRIFEISKVTSFADVRPSAGLTVEGDGSVSMPAPRWIDGTVVAPSSTSPAGGVLDANRGVVTWRKYDAKASYSYDFKRSFTVSGGAVEFSGHVSGVKPQAFTVSFDSAGGGRVASQSVSEGGRAVRPADPKRAGYVFAGWYTRAGKAFDFSSVVKSDVALVAHWKAAAKPSQPSKPSKPSKPSQPRVFTVSFDSAGGGKVASQSVSEGGRAVRPADPKRAGYVFAGWYTRAGKAFDFDSVVRADVTLVAHWKAAAKPSQPAVVSTVTMWRLYNPNSGEHFYTANTVERDNLIRLGWHDEHVGWVAPDKSSDPVYRMYNPNAGDHHYTLNWAEVTMLKRAGWRYEGIGWYSATNEGRTPLYREYNPNARSGAHNFTLNVAEHRYLGTIGWHLEGTAWYAVHGL